MLIRFERPWRVYLPGTITDKVPDGAANELCRRGVAVEVKEVRAPSAPTTTRPSQAGRRRV